MVALSKIEKTFKHLKDFVKSPVRSTKFCDGSLLQLRSSFSVRPTKPFMPLCSDHHVIFLTSALGVLRFRPWIRLRSRILGFFGIPIPDPDLDFRRSGSTLDPDPALNPEPQVDPNPRPILAHLALDHTDGAYFNIMIPKMSQINHHS